MHSVFNKETFSDIRIRCGSVLTDMPGHKLVLHMSDSAFLHEKLNGDQIDLPQFNAETIRLCIGFFYGVPLPLLYDWNSLIYCLRLAKVLQSEKLSATLMSAPCNNTPAGQIIDSCNTQNCTSLPRVDDLCTDIAIRGFEAATRQIVHMAGIESFNKVLDMFTHRVPAIGLALIAARHNSQHTTDPQVLEERLAKFDISAFGSLEWMIMSKINVMRDDILVRIMVKKHPHSGESVPYIVKILEWLNA